MFSFSLPSLDVLFSLDLITEACKERMEAARYTVLLVARPEKACKCRWTCTRGRGTGFTIDLTLALLNVSDVHERGAPLAHRCHIIIITWYFYK